MRALKWLDKYAEEFVLVMLLIAMCCVILLQIIMRYVFRYALPWPEEFSRFCYIFTGFVSLGYCTQRNKMLRVDIIYELVPSVVKKVLDAFGAVIVLAFYAYGLYHSILAVEISRMLGTTSPALELPLYILNMSVPIGFTAGLIRQIQRIVKGLISFFRKKPAVVSGDPSDDLGIPL